MAACPFAVALWLALAPAPKPSVSYDWPQWRGPTRDGVSHETGLRKRWPEEGPPVAWQAKNLGGGYSAPAVAGGRVFGMSYRGNDEVVWALAEKDGKELWVQRVAAKGKAGYNEGPRCTPAVDDDRLYALGISGDLVCLEIESGKIVWRKNFKEDFGGEMMSGWGYSESPLVDGDRVVCTPGGEKKAPLSKNAIVAFDKRSGSLVWGCDVPKAGGAGYSSLVKTQVGGLTIYLTLMGKSGGVVAVDAREGRFLWKYTHVANDTANIPTVIARDDYVFCSSGYRDGGAGVLKLSADGNKVKYEEVAYHPARDLQNHHGGMVPVGDYVYMGRGHKNGFPTCVELKTGKIVWAEERGPGEGSAALAYADGMLYFRYENGVMALIEATPKEYNLVSTFRLPDPSGKPSWPHPVIANGKLLIRDQDRLTCFNVQAPR
jgi:outer membrane protein assembly factor BamB